MEAKHSNTVIFSQQKNAVSQIVNTDWQNINVCYGIEAALKCKETQTSSKVLHAF